MAFTQEQLEQLRSKDCEERSTSVWHGIKDQLVAINRGANETAFLSSKTVCNQYRHCWSSTLPSQVTRQERGYTVVSPLVLGKPLRAEDSDVLRALVVDS